MLDWHAGLATRNHGHAGHCEIVLQAGLEPRAAEPIFKFIYGYSEVHRNAYQCPRIGPARVEPFPARGLGLIHGATGNGAMDAVEDDGDRARRDPGFRPPAGK